tara:strand:- start:640 stop:2571 length:1932 start_codon:yes stop_codon:yes gene_type:complete
MAQTIQIKSSTGATNTPASLATGELAINVTTGSLFYGSATTVHNSFTFGALTVTGNTVMNGTLSTSSVNVGTGAGSVSAATITASGEIDGGSLDIEGDADINGTTNLDEVDVDGDITMADGKQLFLGSGTAGDPSITFLADTDTGLRLNAVGSLRLTVAGEDQIAVGDGAVYPVTSSDVDLGLSSGYYFKDLYIKSINCDGDISGATLDISGNADIDGTTNLDAVDIDGAVQIDNTLTVGVDDTGYDVKFFGATSGKYMLWDESHDALDVVGNLNVSGTTTYIGAISGTGSVTAVGGFVGDVTGNVSGSAGIAAVGTVTNDAEEKMVFLNGSNMFRVVSSGFSFNPSTKLLTATGFVGNLTGNADTVTNGVYTSNNLSVMAATTSTQLRGVLSDETGTGSAVFATSPTLVTPVLGTPSSGTLTNCTGYPEAALPSSINAIKIADGTVTSTEFQYINTLSANAQTQINTVHSTRSHFVTTTCILKVYASNTWSGFNTSTGGLNTNGYWNLDTGETDIADAYTYYDTSKNALFTTPYAGKIKRLLINGTSQTGAAVADTINVHLAKATLTDGNDRPNWSQVTATTETLPGTAGTTAHKSKHYVWDIPINMAVAQYDSFLLLFKNPNNQLTWLPINILIEFEYTIT